MQPEIREVLHSVADTDAMRAKSWGGSLMEGLDTFFALMRGGGIRPDTPHYRTFAQNRLERYLWSMVGPEPSTTLRRAKRGCGQCRPCTCLDDFLVSEEDSIQLVLGPEDMTHIIDRLNPDSGCLDFIWKPKRPGPARELFTITKKHDPTRKFTITSWAYSATRAKDDISSLTSERFLRQVLGSKYHEITTLQGLRLVRDATGKEVGLARYSLDVPPAPSKVYTVPGLSSAQDQQQAVDAMLPEKESEHESINPPTNDNPPTALLKRKAACDADQENVVPAKRTLVIDLGDGSDDDEDW
ncbi:hypothetical protein Slin15195_G079160 [Septoria linicola]|uniref:Uncharacterized protein n=1 Tax=Septoria linicola TaxID=215465 RepID=A0A9Q9AZ92_9PEZI|nr:hypothetical protein Slin14017_G040360 [Septoria linicola]USW54597.1 hypothetical protein Slin15195_G079160 [Septoria linicola]